MARTKISEFSATPANNTDIDSINIAEGCAPSGINDAIRELMAQLKDFQTGAVGDSFNGPIGSTSAVTGAFTTLSATGAITSTLATGSAPLVIASTTKVANLNVDLLDGADWASPAALGSTTPAAVSATTLTTSSTVTLNGGTANGVAYLNGSKVVTSGSALTFDGTDFSATGTTTVNSANSTQVALVVKGETGNGIRQRFIGQASSGQYNWQIGASITAAGSFAIIPSTAVDGTTFSTAAYSITGTGTSIWAVGGSEQMRLTSTGLGIGTSSPNFRLDVQAPTGVIKLTATTGTNASYFRADNSGGILYFGLDDSTASTFGTAGAYGTVIQRPASTAFNINRAGTVDFYISTTGNVGIGTSSPSQKLNVVGNVRVEASSGNRYVEVASSTSSLQFGTDGSSQFIYGVGAFPLTFSTNSAERARIDSSGNFGVGTTSPNAKIQASGSGSVSFRATTSDGGGVNLDMTVSGSAVELGSPNGVPLVFKTTNTERARINANGSLLIGKTSEDITIPSFQYRQDIQSLAVTTSSSGISNTYLTRTANTGNFISFLYSTGLTAVGSISTDGSSTAYNTSSDYRLKNTIAPMTGALAKVALLKPCTYKWNADGSDGEGFIAHELAEVVPQCVTGEKDAVETYTDEDGNEQTRPKYQGIDTSFLVATLTAAIQELKAEFDAYKASHP